MSLKFIFFITLTLFFLTTISLTAQQPVSTESAIASVKYKLTDFKDSSVENVRYALARFSSDDKLFAVLGEKRHIGIYQTESGKLLRSIDFGTDGTDAFSFSPDGKSILMKDRFSFSVEVWDLETGKRQHKLEGRNGVSGFKNVIFDTDRRRKQVLEMSELPISRDGKNILIGKNDRRYDIVELAGGTPLFQLEQDSKSSDTKDVLKLFLFPERQIRANYFTFRRRFTMMPETESLLPTEILRRLSGTRKTVAWSPNLAPRKPESTT